MKSNFAFVATPGLPDFFWPGVRFGDRQPVVGDVFKFEPAYSARGPEAGEVEGQIRGVSAVQLAACERHNLVYWAVGSSSVARPFWAEWGTPTVGGVTHPEAP